MLYYDGVCGRWRTSRSHHEREPLLHRESSSCSGKDSIIYYRLHAPKTRNSSVRIQRSLERQSDSAHSDLKPDNLVMVSHSCDSDVKIIDFGLSAVSLQECQGKVGTAYYMAPEILKGENYDEKIDIWSIGVVLYLLLFGVLPFGGRTREELNRSILEKDLVFPENSPVSGEARKFLRELLIKNSCERLSASQALGSNWIYQPVVSSSTELSETKKNLRRFQAKRKLRKFLYVILAVVVWRRICKHRHVSQIPFTNSMEIIDDDDPIHSTSEGF